MEKLQNFKKKTLISITNFQDDEDGHLVVLIIIEELMSKTKDEFLDHFARLGVFTKVQALMGPSADSDDLINKSEEGGTKKGKMISENNYFCRAVRKTFPKHRGRTMTLLSIFASKSQFVL